MSCELTTKKFMIFRDVYCPGVNADKLVIQHGVNITFRQFK